MEGCRLLEIWMGMGLQEGDPPKEGKRVQERGDSSHPVDSRSKLSLMIVVSDPTSRLRLLLLLSLLRFRAGENSGRTCFVTT